MECQFRWAFVFFSWWLFVVVVVVGKTKTFDQHQHKETVTTNTWNVCMCCWVCGIQIWFNQLLCWSSPITFQWWWWWSIHLPLDYYTIVCVIDGWLVVWLVGGNIRYLISMVGFWFPQIISIYWLYIYWPIILCKRPEEKPPFSFSLNVEQQWMEIGKLIHWSSEMYRTHTHNLLLLLSTVKPIQVYGKLAQFFVTTTIALNTTTTTNSWW